ncbi:MAG: hypothetical protein NT062_11775 [Proteobacteria bacterium]|nr:hypothetical protein [Pseudomonadota bacterium]
MMSNGPGLPPLVAQSSPAIPLQANQSMGMPQGGYGSSPGIPNSGVGLAPQQSYPSASGVGYQMPNMPKSGSKTWLWVLIGLLALGAAAGAVLAIVMK